MRPTRRSAATVGVGHRAVHPGGAAPRPLRAGVDRAPGEDAARDRRPRHHPLHPARRPGAGPDVRHRHHPRRSPPPRPPRGRGRVRTALGRASPAPTSHLARTPGASSRGRVFHGDARHLDHRAARRATRAGGAGGDLTAVRAVHPRPGHRRRPGRRCTNTTTSTAAPSTAGTWPTSATTGCWPGSPASSPALAPYLRPGGHVAITVRPWREHAELIDLPTQIPACGTAAGLIPVERCVALLARITDDTTVVARGSFFQRDFIRKQRDAGLPLHLIAHEDVLDPGPAVIPASSPHDRHGHHDGRHDGFSSRAAAAGCPQPRPGLWMPDPARIRTRDGRPATTPWPFARAWLSACLRRDGRDDGRRPRRRPGHRDSVTKTAPAAPTAPAQPPPCCPCTHRPRPPACWRCRSPGCGGR